MTRDRVVAVTVWVAGCLILGHATSARALAINVSASVDSTNEQIGTVTTTDAGAFTAKFEFQEDDTFLDDWFDFRWVQVITAITDDTLAITEIPAFGSLPAIDPAPSDNLPTDDGPAPYYYNGQEWADAVFGGDTIRSDNEFSLFIDGPSSQPANRLIEFSLFLVVADITAGIIDPNNFAVLAGVTWTHDAGVTTGAGDDDNTVGAAITINAGAISLINSALANAEVGGDFGDWTAIDGSTIDFTECAVPEPGSASLLLAAVVGYLLWVDLSKRRIRSA